ncbi:MAG: 2,3-bisphosphoglycerate-independent phosphoglycerate mutase [Gammaproteobacteria bacterium]|nr:2,3-bisphosphoglycerate-independent phosphoglycerate mutase [Gammaproteobacteria bacterium]MBT3488161.1 2,3-bisphosphoglycerate-independent phosphoglycerate mutase [Gammaproteobacteria bacterium]MBT3718457.1 2,3-bisphosphoglycerate-independent phosphoglycerate mutase [Gammaproteobacteria bacterium]MBT3844120.1 2,3-bisphosphoglycerate-independent phosphoglycerate mutase [Gammaproteobacteria bacterium]MBT3892249.1 2,3-bisphosphoglycerate-independent phosphoglycerate mutase [Gammaproteobacteria
MSVKRGPAVLCILDGWGYRESPDCNAIAAAKTPVWDQLWAEKPRTLIVTHGAEVGLPADQMGNSEVGHLNLGAGRVVYQEYTRICRSIRTHSFYSNQTLVDPIDQAIREDKAIHVLGLLSPGGVHSHEEHIHSIVRMAADRGARKIYLHAFLDGRDTPPRSATPSLEMMETVFRECGVGKFASIVGRYYSMDRDRRWKRVEASYRAMVEGVAIHSAPTALKALEQAYARGESDEFVDATIVVAEGETPARMEDGDVVLLMNYRSDRARQLTEALIMDDFHGFDRNVWPVLGSVTSLTEYKRGYNIPVAFPPDRLNNVFGEYISKFGLHQLRIAETEKYAHITFFFNGGREEPFPFEERLLICSPDVQTYDLQPEMSAYEVTSRLVDEIRSGEYDVIICNLANSDMVGHTGKLDAAIKAVETLDHCIEKVVTAVQEVNGDLLLTADHGNSETMCDRETGQPHTAHTMNPVPLIYVGKGIEIDSLHPGALSDIAPTLLHIMGIEKPTEMTGQSLIDEVK